MDDASSHRVGNGSASDAVLLVPGNGAGAAGNGTAGMTRIDLVRSADGVTPPDPGGLLRPISPARTPGSRRQRHEEARAARAEELAATASAIDTGPHTAPDPGAEGNGNGAADAPDLLEWAELKLPPIQDEDDDHSPYEGLPPEPIAHGDGAGGPVAAEAGIAAEDRDDLDGPDDGEPQFIPVLLEEEPEAHEAADDAAEASAVSEGRATDAEILDDLDDLDDDVAAAELPDLDDLDDDVAAAELPDLEQPSEVRPSEVPPEAAAAPAAISPAPPEPSPFGPTTFATPPADAERPTASAPPQPPPAFALVPPATVPSEPETETEPVPVPTTVTEPTPAPEPPTAAPEPTTATEPTATPETLGRREPIAAQPPLPPPSAFPPAGTPPVPPPAFASPAAPAAPPAAEPPLHPATGPVAPPLPPPAFAPPSAGAPLPPPPVGFAPIASDNPLPPPTAAFPQPDAEVQPPPATDQGPAEATSSAPPPAFTPQATDPTLPPPPPGFTPQATDPTLPPPPPAFTAQAGAPTAPLPAGLTPPPAYDAPIAPPPAYEPAAFTPAPPPPPATYEPTADEAMGGRDLYPDDADLDHAADQYAYADDAPRSYRSEPADDELVDYDEPADDELVDYDDADIDDADTDDYDEPADHADTDDYDEPADHADTDDYDEPADDADIDHADTDDYDEAAGGERAGYGDGEETAAAEPAYRGAALELRQIAGLTAGIDLELDRAGHEFAEGDQSVAFTITVDDKDRAVLVPGTMAVKLDTQPVAEPTLIGWGALDVGSARFIVRPRRSFPRADEWLAQRDAFDRPEREIEVPPTLGVQAAVPAGSDRGRRRFGRRRSGEPDAPTETLNAESWEFIDRIRAARADLADRERYLHPDPAELVVRTSSRAPILGLRPPGHPLFGKVGVIVADMPWMPNFDDIRAIPDSLGPYLQPLMSLPSIPIAADLLVGPLGIVGSRAAAAACARHIILSLHALSTADLRVHIAASPERAPVWDWAYDLADHDDLDLDHGFPVVVVDGIENFGRYGLTHADAIERRVGVVILTDSIDDLPNYCGSVLQVDRSGSALLTNHLGHVIAGTPVGVANDFARHLADDLNALYRQRR